MSTEGFTRLSAELRATPPAGLQRLDEDQLHDLADAVRDMCRREGAELEAAGEQALSHIPRLLRGPVRKVVG